MSVEPTRAPLPTKVTQQMDPRPRADYVMIGTTDSLCPECMEVVPAKIITRGPTSLLSQALSNAMVCEKTSFAAMLVGGTVQKVTRRPFCRPSDQRSRRKAVPMIAACAKNTNSIRASV